MFYHITTETEPSIWSKLVPYQTKPLVRSFLLDRKKIIHFIFNIFLFLKIKNCALHIKVYIAMSSMNTTRASPQPTERSSHQIRAVSDVVVLSFGFGTVFLRVFPLDPLFTETWDTILIVAWKYGRIVWQTMYINLSVQNTLFKYMHLYIIGNDIYNMHYILNE